MKKTLLYLILAAGLVGCAKEQAPASEENQAGKPMTFEINVLETKAAKTAWADGDVIYVFFRGLKEYQKYLVLTYNDGSWTNAPGNGEFLETDFSEISNKTLTAVHFPVPVEVDVNIDFNTYELYNYYSFTKDGKPVYCHYYLYETNKAYTVDGTTVTASLSMCKPDGLVLFHVAGIEGAASDYTFGCPLVEPVTCAEVKVANGLIKEDYLQAGTRQSGIPDSDGVIFGGHLTTTGSADYTFTLASDDKIYTLTRKGKTLEGGKMYNFPGLSDSDWSVQNPSDLYVDLGLTSGVKWAKYNLGAAETTDYGSHFAEGELQPKAVYSDDTYTLRPLDDAAYAALGGKFRIPSKADWDELLKECDTEWTTQNDIKGLLVKSKDGSGNSIFIPAAGMRNKDGLQDQGINGYYRTSDAGTSFRFSDGSTTGIAYPDSDGFSVRPVYK